MNIINANAGTERQLASSELQKRIISSVLLILIALVGVLAGQYWAILVLAGFGVLAIYEWLDLLRPPQVGRLQSLCYAAVVLTLLTGAWVTPFYGVALLALMTGGVFVFGVVASKKAPTTGAEAKFPPPFAHAAWVALGVPYIAGGVLAVLTIRLWPMVGLGMTMYLLLVVWGTDIGAYIIGRRFGGAKLFPAISPSKTWAGLFGGIATAVCLGYVCALAFNARAPLAAAGLAAVLATVAQIGDLFESYLKRRCGAKDSGHLIPGHGGVLDRIDGLLAAAVFLALLQSWQGEVWVWW